MLVHELQALLETKAPLQLIDVREPAEWNHVRIAGATHIPLRALPARMFELDRKALTVCYCHHGGRSYQAQMFLQQNGFTDVHNLDGGIDAWAAVVDPSLPRY